ncbi:MAG TPA: hypothetical protein VGI33_12705 [Paenibacillus sp.]|jgi:heme-degrading monooxygenase HmoA
MYALVSNEYDDSENIRLILSLFNADETLECYVTVRDSKDTMLNDGSFSVKTAHLEKQAEGKVFGRKVMGVYNVPLIEEAVSVSHSILPLIRQQPGFIGVFLFVKPTGENFSISIWETEEDSNFNIESGWWMDQVRKFDSIYVDKPITTNHWLSIEGELLKHV